jgi:hypothetical protein
MVSDINTFSICIIFSSYISLQQIRQRMEDILYKGYSPTTAGCLRGMSSSKNEVFFHLHWRNSEITSPKGSPQTITWKTHCDLGWYNPINE